MKFVMYKMSVWPCAGIRGPRAALCEAAEKDPLLFCLEVRADPLPLLHLALALLYELLLQGAGRCHDPHHQGGHSQHRCMQMGGWRVPSVPPSSLGENMRALGSNLASSMGTLQLRYKWAYMRLTSRQVRRGGQGAD